MTTFLVFAVGIAVLLGLAVLMLVRRGAQFKLLLEDGVNATGRVVDKPKFGRVNSSKKYRHLRYRYQDASGNEHVHRAQVTSSVYDAHEVDGPIEIVYSRSKPEVSAPRSLVDAARK
jgi:hypothetical protein